MVFQETKLFTGTVKENIRYGKLDATDEEVEQAAKLSNADSFIRLLPDGYDTMLANAGESLSQGQRQLLSIARAAISNPPVLILDEATSSIDSRTETLVQKGMDAIMEGRTVFVIAHRLSTGQELECHHGPGSGKDHRARYARGSAEAERQILSALYGKEHRQVEKRLTGQDARLAISFVSCARSS
jgi:ABC-type transport system involved in cytochrome bd biosynthesis fused ATPase/permease subunit